MSSISISEVRKNLPVFKEQEKIMLDVKEKLIKQLRKECRKTGDREYDRTIEGKIRKAEKEIEKILESSLLISEVEGNMERLKKASEMASRLIAKTKRETERLLQERKKRVKEAEKKLDSISKIEVEGKNIYVEKVKEKINELLKKKDLIYTNINSFEKIFEKTKKEIDENSLYSSIINSFKIEIPEEEEKEIDENQKLILEEKKLKEKREEEERALSETFKNSIRALMEIGARQVGETLLKQEKITREQYSAFLNSLFEEKRKESFKEQSKETKEEIINSLLLMGYTVEEKGEEMFTVETEDPEYRIMMKVKEGQVAAKLIKLVGEENYTPSEYERIKDEEVMEKWCSDFDRIKKELREKGFEVKEKVEVRKMEGVNYVYEPSVAVRKEKTERKMEK